LNSEQPRGVALAPTNPIDTFIPGCTDRGRRIRQRLLKARDLASSRVANLSSGHARSLTWMLIETATWWVFSPATPDDLEDVANHCLRLFMCADFAEQMENGRG
jgi:hypothetical protein